MKTEFETPKEISKFLLEDLAKMLTDASGFLFVFDGTEVKPESKVEYKARLKELGSFTLNIKPEPYFNQTLAKWKNKHGIKT